MAKVFSKALCQTIEVERVIAHIKGKHKGPVLIFVGGIHGNEPSGVFALNQVVQELRKNKIELKGSLYALSGNLNALEKNQRFYKKDLNRLWTDEKIHALDRDLFRETSEDESEQKDIYYTIHNIILNETGPFYFFDLHTTSCKTIPFLTVSDNILNRKFTKQYPTPIILGIEEYLHGPLLSYISELGYVSFGFESGQHDDIISIENHVAFIYLSLVFTEAIEKSSINFDYYYQQLAKASKNNRNIYKIFFRYRIKPNEKFIMQPDYINFQRINRGQLLAKSNGKPVIASQSTHIFLPLYQPFGKDGFFTIRRVQHFFLNLSTIFRKRRLDKILYLLPGVNWKSDKKDSLIVNKKIACLFTKPFLSFIGYQRKQANEKHLVFRSRESASRKDEYKNEIWLSSLAKKQTC